MQSQVIMIIQYYDSHYHFAVGHKPMYDKCCWRYIPIFRPFPHIAHRFTLWGWCRESASYFCWHSLPVLPVSIFLNSLLFTLWNSMKLFARNVSRSFLYTFMTIFYPSWKKKHFSKKKKRILHLSHINYYSYFPKIEEHGPSSYKYIQDSSINCHCFYI